MTVVVVNTDDAVALLSEADEGELRAALVVLEEALRERAKSRGDLDTLIEVGFNDGFSSSGHAKDPWIESGVVLCPGSGVEKSALSHDCTYVSVEGSWVWESEETLLHEVRHIPAGPRRHQRTVSLLDAREGLCFDVVHCQMRHSVHQLRAASSYVINNGAVELVSTRAVKAPSHR